MSTITGLYIGLAIIVLGAGGLTLMAMYFAHKYGPKDDDNK